MRRALVSLPDGIWKIIDEELKGKIGSADSEIIRNIVIGFLTEKGYLIAPRKAKGVSKGNQDKSDTLDLMLTTLAEILEEKGVLEYEQWENRIRRKIEDLSRAE